MTSLIQSFDPSNGELLGEVENSTTQQVNAAVARAKAAQKFWRKTNHPVRV